MRARLTPALPALALLGLACSTYRGTAHDVSPAAIQGDGWLRVADVPLVLQEHETDCGAAALAMVASYWTGAEPVAIRDAIGKVSKNGINARRLRDVARRLRLAAYLLRGEVADLEHEIANGRPVLVGLHKPQKKGTLAHYEVVVALHPTRRMVVTHDPAHGLRENTLDGFLAEWKPAGRLA